MLFIYPTPQYPRKSLEYVYKSLYLLANIAHTIAIVVLITDFYTRLKDSMPGYFTNSNLVVSPVISMAIENCTYTGVLRLGSVKGSVTVNHGAIVVGLMNMAMYVQGLFVLEFLLLVNNMLCALNYSSGNRHLRCFGVHVPLYHITMVFTYVYSIAITVLTWVYDNNRAFYHRALVFCAGELSRSNPSALVEAEYDDYSIFTTAAYWPFGAVCFSTLIYFSAGVVLAIMSSDKATRLLSEADAPWEARGVMATTKKPLLKLHTAQRNAILEDARNAMKKGEKVRIVRSYQLMTEEDFDALVQAMRDQVNRSIKEQQFEMMRENFGDGESDIDDMGFLWRQPLMAADPGGEGDQFNDANMGDYLTDNDYNDLGSGRLDDRMGRAGAGLGPDGLPLPPPDDLVLFTTDPIFPPDDDDAGDRGGGGRRAGGGDDDLLEAPQSRLLLDDHASPAPGPFDDDGRYRSEFPIGGGVDEDSRGAHRPRHRHSRRHSRRRVEQGEDVPYRYDSEPDPRLPPMHEYSPQEGADTGEYSGGRHAGRGKKRRGGGRQAEVEDDVVDADALSGGDDFY